MDKRRRVQVDLNTETLDHLDDLANATRKSSKDRRLGAGTIAARLLKVLVSHPEITNQLLEEYNALGETLLIAAERREEYETPKKAGRKR